MSAAPAPSRVQVVGALLTVWLLWGSTFLGIRVLVGQVPALFAAGVRFTIAGAVLLIVVAWRTPGVLSRLRGTLRWLALLGVLHFLVANGMVSLAEQRLESGTTGVLFATVPLWLMGLRALTGQRPRAVEVVAGLVGMVGVLVLFGLHAAGPLLPSVEVLGAACAWAVAGYLAGQRRDLQPLDPALSSAMQMVFGGVALLTVALVSGEWSRLPDPSQLSLIVWLAGGHLILFGSLVGFWAYIWLVARVDAQLASTYAYVQPIVTVLLGWLLLGEHVMAAELAGSALIIGAVAWTVSTRAAAARRRLSPDKHTKVKGQHEHVHR
jgi:drug/metabolite transporter (DMT)-like permease